ncbi:hypothetical protein EMIT0P265_40319 [Pseudomonas zeae]
MEGLEEPCQVGGCRFSKGSIKYIIFLSVRVLLATRCLSNPSSPSQRIRDPLRHLRNNGISGTESLRKVGRIQSEAKPIILSRSLPLSHLIPSVRVSDESGAAHSDLRGGSVRE